MSSSVFGFLYSSNWSSKGSGFLNIIEWKCLFLQILPLLSKLYIYWFPSNSLSAFAPRPPIWTAEKPSTRLFLPQLGPIWNLNLMKKNNLFPAYQLLFPRHQRIILLKMQLAMIIMHIQFSKCLLKTFFGHIVFLKALLFQMNLNVFAKRSLLDTVAHL